jgi:diguanylate cyclase (GGDEF)-like protein
MPELRGARGLRLLLLVAAVAAAYYLSGRAGLLLAIPPGYATAVWPASGIALAVAVLAGPRVLPGVALGSLAVNLFTGYDPGAPLRSSIVPAVIALGAAAQAGLGAWLIARHVGYRNVLVQELGAVRMLVLGGPVACLVNATLGPACLWLNGQLPADALLLTAGTWWVGDTIGVLIFAPLVWVWGARPLREWLPRQLLVTVPLAALFATVVTMFVFIERHEQGRLMTEFERGARVLAREVRRDLAATLNSLNALEGLYASSAFVDEGEFATFATRLLAATPAIQGFSWNPVVAAAERQRFEAAVRAAGRPDFRIEEWSAAGTRVPAGPREYFAPIRYIAPGPENRAVYGFDTASEPVRRAALEAARDSGQPVATAPVQTLQGGGGIVMFAPVFQRGAAPQATEARREQLHGFVVAVLGLERFMRATASAAARAGMSVDLRDAGPAAPAAAVPDTGAEATPGGGLRLEIILPFGGRDLRLVFGLPAEAVLARRSWATWAVLAGGMALTGVVGIMLLLGVGREAHFEALVRERTDRLRLSEEQARHQATHDPLTGLPNRLLFLDRMEQAIERGRRAGQRFGLLYLDIDGFKAVNDTQGHHAGDELLRQIAGRLREAVRGEDTVARLGGDEFAVLLAPPVDAAGAQGKAQRLVAALGAPYALAAPDGAAAEARVGASVGVALFPDHGGTVDEVVHAADDAMYQAKKGGKNSSRLAG